MTIVGADTTIFIAILKLRLCYRRGALSTRDAIYAVSDVPHLDVLRRIGDKKSLNCQDNLPDLPYNLRHITQGNPLNAVLRLKSSGNSRNELTFVVKHRVSGNVY